jgi:hypothetical protein
LIVLFVSFFLILPPWRPSKWPIPPNTFLLEPYFIWDAPPIFYPILLGPIAFIILILFFKRLCGS